MLLGTGTKVYAGEVVLYPVYTMCRSHKLWGPDAGEFKPERWIDEQGRVRKESHFKCGCCGVWGDWMVGC